MEKYSKRAFSLIELSIVLIIIGVLIAGIVGGKQLINVSGLSSARSLTGSSPVNGIENLTLWLEATSKKSFDISQPVDGDSLPIWKDINPQTTDKNSTNGVSTSNPTYSERGINGLPSVKFNGTSNYFNLPDGSFGVGNEPYSIFLVVRVLASGVQDILFSLGPVNGSSTRIQTRGSQAQFIDNWSGSSQEYETNYLALDGKANIVVSTYNPSNVSYKRSMYINGVFYPNISGDGSENLTRNASEQNCGLGSSISVYNRHFNGLIGEVIIFNRALSSFERKEIENYLSKKWKIKLQ